MPRPIDIAIVNGYVLPMGGAPEIPNGVVTISNDVMSRNAIANFHNRTLIDIGILI